MPKLGATNQRCLKSAYRHLRKYYGMKYRLIRAYHMQDCIDNCGRGYSTQAIIKTLWGHLDSFAFECDIIGKMYSQLTTSAPTPETSRLPFTVEQINALWAIQNEPWVDTVLIYIYTGFRLMELLTMKTTQVDLEQQLKPLPEKTDWFQFIRASCPSFKRECGTMMRTCFILTAMRFRPIATTSAGERL